MNTKVIIAIAAVAIVAIAGGIAVAILSNDSENDTLDVDVVKTVDQLAVNDFFSMDVVSTRTIDTNFDDATKTDFLMYLYFGGEIEDAPTTEFTYKGSVVICNVYNTTGDGYTSSVYVEPNSKIIYYTSSTTEKYTTTFTLKDTNLDLSKPFESQKVVDGSYYIYDWSGPADSYDGMATGEFKRKMISYDPATDKGTVNIFQDQTAEIINLKMTIKEFNSEGEIIVEGDDEPKTKDDFLNAIKYDSFLKNYEKDGYTITHGEKTTKIINTEFGKRKVTIEKMKLVDGERKEDVTLTYGENGLIYVLEYMDVGNQGWMKITGTLKDTNLFIK